METLSPRGELVRAIANREAVAVFGTGLSVSATKGASAASWIGLLREGIEFCRNYPPQQTAEWAAVQQVLLDDPKLDNILAAATNVEAALKTTGRYNLFLLRTVGALKIRDQTMVEAVRALARGDVTIATTNYDGLIEEATGLPAVSWTDGAMAELVLSCEVKGILHLHGLWSEAASVVLGIRSYDKILHHPLAQARQHLLAHGHRLVFIGYGEGLHDPNFTVLLEWMRETLPDSGRFHFRLCREREADQLRKRHADDRRIMVLPYGAEYADLSPFVSSLLDEARNTTTAIPMRPRTRTRRPRPGRVLTFAAECIPDDASITALVRANPPRAPKIQWHESVQRLIDRVETRFTKFDELADATIPWGRDDPERRQYYLTSHRARLHHDLERLRRFVGAAPEALGRALGLTRDMDVKLRELAVGNFARFGALQVIRLLQMFDQHVFEPGDPPVPFHSFPSLRVPEWLVDLMPAGSPLGDYVFRERQFLRARVGETEDSYEYAVMPRFLADSLHRSGKAGGQYSWCAWVLPQWLIYDYAMPLDPGKWKIWVLKDAQGREAYMPHSQRPWEQ